MSLKNSQTVAPLNLIHNFLDQSQNFDVLWKSGDLNITQKIDSKCVTILSSAVGEVLERQDTDGKSFIQINFQSQVKILITETLIGFKPSEITSLDMSKIPKVVTTPDLVSVQQALQDCLYYDQFEDLEVLKKVYLSILSGAINSGFAMADESQWIQSFSSHQLKAAA
ncbi:MAG: hypothetical protein ACK5WZ_11995 [Pseudobdellovibrionaceae bacterium]